MSVAPTLQRGLWGVSEERPVPAGSGTFWLVPGLKENEHKKKPKWPSCEGTKLGLGISMGAEELRVVGVVFSCLFFLTIKIYFN